MGGMLPSEHYSLVSLLLSGGKTGSGTWETVCIATVRIRRSTREDTLILHHISLLYLKSSHSDPCSPSLT